jgi:hypothetical protein
MTVRDDPLHVLRGRCWRSPKGNVCLRGVRTGTRDTVSPTTGFRTFRSYREVSK